MWSFTPIECDDGEVIQFMVQRIFLHVYICQFSDGKSIRNFLLSEFDCMHSSIQFARELGNQLDGGRISVLRVGQGGV